MFIRTGRFVRTDRLLRSHDFQRVLKSGERKSSRSFVLFFTSLLQEARPAGPPRSKLGITVNKRVGNAVVRNRVKRCIREWFRHAREGLPEGSEIVVIARRKARDLLGCEIASVLDQMIQREEGRRGAV